MDRENVRDYELDIIIKAWRDEEFRQNLLKNAKKTIEKEFAIDIPSHIEISVHEEHENSLHLIVPAIPSDFNADKLSDEELREIVGGVMSSHHMNNFPSSQERTRIKVLQRENQALHEVVSKLKAELLKVKS